MDTAQWPQEIVMKPIEEILPNTSSKPSLERRVRPQALNCPRCNSTNTKFCYYNNYSLTQPRYFCKTCRRYWTQGGSLRNIPVGGVSRKNKRSSSSTSSSSSSITKNPKISNDFKSICELIQVPNFEGNNKNQMLSSSSSSPSSQLSALEVLSGITSKGLNSFMPMPISDPNTVHSSGFSLPEFKPSLTFSLDGVGSSLQETSGRLLFPFEDLKQVSTTTNDRVEHSIGENGDSNAYWNGMFGGGLW